MIKKLDKTYHNKLMKLLSKDLEFNLFIIGDIENNGYDNYFLQVWGEVDEKNEIVSVLMKYFSYAVFYSCKEDYDVDGFIDLLESIRYDELSGKKECIEPLIQKLDYYKKRDVNFCKLCKSDYIDSAKLKYKVKKIKFGNINKVVKLYSEIDEFYDSTPESIKANLKSGRGYCIEVDKKVVSMAKTTSENDTHAMIIGVGTHPNYRGYGYATNCMLKLCKEILKENKTLCLFYDNKEAGYIYEKLGFEFVGTWSILIKEK